MKSFLRALILVGGGLLCFGCRTVCQKEETVMGPIIARITVVSGRMSAEEMESAVRAAFVEVHMVDGLMSHYKTDSDVSRLNESKQNIWVQLDPLTFTVLEESLRIAELTKGAFDPTVLPLMESWGFWPVRDPKVPSEEELEQALSHIGYEKLSLDHRRCALLKSDPEVRLDLGAIAKGYAVDRAMEVLKKRGLEDALVEIGGETRAMGRNKNGRPWRIGVLHPTRRGYLTILELSNKAVATSGDYMSFFIVNGKRYCHLINPRTGRPISNNVSSVTVIANNCTQADALATAVSVLGAEEGLKLIESLPGIEAIIATRTDGGETIKIMTSSGLKGLSLNP